MGFSALLMELQQVFFQLSSTYNSHDNQLKSSGERAHFRKPWTWKVLFKYPCWLFLVHRKEHFPNPLKAHKLPTFFADLPRCTSTKRAWYGWLPNSIAAPLRVQSWKIEDAGCWRTVLENWHDIEHLQENSEQTKIYKVKMQFKSNFNTSEVHSICFFTDTYLSGVLSTLLWQLWRKGLDERTMHLTNYSVNKHAACEKLSVRSVEMCQNCSG